MCDRLHVSLQVHLGQRMHVLVNALAQLGDADQLAKLSRRQVVEPLPAEKKLQKTP